ncbi:MAG TPA: hypothetical protein VFM82_03655 [Flavobacteriaceae bacterium]|nr:hypothetical protein [Flavobacteriaceae bacterium]
MENSIILISIVAVAIAGTYAIQWAFKQVEKAVKEHEEIKKQL